ncbi:MAG: carbohydrate ABC transporter permease [Desulfobacterales bacterium]|nr:carbohydrate ABC transporter permease [Desulfobacterales bacterium]
MMNKRLVNSYSVNGLLLVICVLWTLPTFGLLMTSFRDRDVVSKTGWWTVFTRPSQASLTMDNYKQVLSGKTITLVDHEGNKQTVKGDNLNRAFLNSLTVSIPAVVIPILIASFAAYGFAWMDFPGRKLLFIIVVALLVVPLQISLIPLLRDYGRLELTGTFLAIWLAHTGFGLPLSVYLMYNYISQLPRSVIESAIIDGCSHFGVFWKLVLPLSVPAIASLSIFQFLWVWNDILVALVFIGSKPGV